MLAKGGAEGPECAMAVEAVEVICKMRPVFMGGCDVVAVMVVGAGADSGAQKVLIGQKFGKEMHVQNTYSGQFRDSGQFRNSDVRMRCAGRFQIPIRN
jgi:hypothetical protein